jgi:natural resistance-associated macrophage protein
MQEVIGTAIALFLLSNGRLPIYGGVLVTILDTFTFLFIDRYGLRKLEAFFASLILIMALSFGYEFFSGKPEIAGIALGIVFPYCRDCPKEALSKAVGIIGAIIAPHNLYLHSALVKSRKIDRKNKNKVKEANKYVAIESAMALFVSLLINVMVISVFAYGLNGKTNKEIRENCKLNGTIFSYEPSKAFPVEKDANDLVEADLYRAGIFLGCSFGLPALYVWAVGLFAAGQSSTMTGTYAGQFVMQGFLNLKWRQWKRVLFTRCIAILPTLSLAVSVDNISDLTGMNDVLNVVMTFMLPFALFPVLIFSCSQKVMKPDFKAGLIAKMVLFLLSTTIICINVIFVTITVLQSLAKVWYVYLALVMFMSLYLSFIVFLFGCLLVVNGYTFPLRIPFFGRFMNDDYEYIEADIEVQESRRE